MAEASAWMPLYIGDYLADTMHLSNSEHGAYLLLIMHYWRTGPLPDDDRALAAISRTDRKEWAAEIGLVIRGFFEPKNGRLHHKRIDFELTKAMQNSSKRREAANARWGQSRSKTDANAYANASVVQSTRNDPRAQSPSPSPSKKDSDLRSASVDAAESAPATARDALWRDGVPIIRGLIGLSEAQSRSFLGKLLKVSRDDCARLYSVLREAEALKPIDPRAWLSRSATPVDERDLQDELPVVPSELNPTGRRFTRMTGGF